MTGSSILEVVSELSSRLIDLFYQQLAKGLDKDEAFRQAKLAYLKESDGRMLAPAYWAGLVLLGDTASIKMAQQTRRSIWITGALLFMAGVIFVFVKRKNVAKNMHPQY
jgi:hypothetical protein